MSLFTVKGIANCESMCKLGPVLVASVLKLAMLIFSSLNSLIYNVPSVFRLNEFNSILGALQFIGHPLSTCNLLSGME